MSHVRFGWALFRCAARTRGPRATFTSCSSHVNPNSSYILRCWERGIFILWENNVLFGTCSCTLIVAKKLTNSRPTTVRSCRTMTCLCIPTGQQWKYGIWMIIPLGIEAWRWGLIAAYVCWKIRSHIVVTVIHKRITFEQGMFKSSTRGKPTCWLHAYFVGKVWFVVNHVSAKTATILGDHFSLGSTLRSEWSQPCIEIW